MITDIYSVLPDAAWAPEYYEKMIHPIPMAKVVDREEFILDHARGRRVVNFGSASGRLHEKIRKVAKSAFGVDKEEPTDLVVNLDDEFYHLDTPDADLYVVGEVIEHLSNPGRFLQRLKGVMKHGRVPYAIITVPNALSSALRKHAERGIENVNVDHVAFYTWHTLKVLVERAGFEVRAFFYYNGVPVFAEGLIFLVR